MEYQIEVHTESGICEIHVSGAVIPADAIDTLNAAWSDDRYINSRYVIWNLSGCGHFPDFNEFIHIVNHVRKNKPHRGPGWIAFVSPNFANSMLVKIFHGFAKATPWRVSFSSTTVDAISWFRADDSTAA